MTARWEKLPLIHPGSTLQLTRLPDLHRDPFDDVFARDPRVDSLPNWSMLPDGRFVMLRDAEQPETAQIVVIQNFHRILEEKVPPIE